MKTNIYEHKALINRGLGKKIAVLTGILLSGAAFSQVAIGKTSVDGKGILDFGNDGDKGIILPVAEVVSANTYADGTFLMDKDDKKIKVYQDGAWLELSDEGDFTVQKDEDDKALTTARTLNTSDENGGGVIIGAVDADGKAVSGADGVLVLEASDKALILPKVASPHLSVKSPVAGTMCYDTDSDSLAVFDGKVWSYWK